jgi:hypothetical protein
LKPSLRRSLKRSSKRSSKRSLKRFLITLFSLLPAGVGLSCGGSTPSSSTQTSGLKDRALISNSVSAGNLAAGVYILNAATDQPGSATAISVGNTPRMMVVTPNRADTIVFSGSGTQSSDNQLSIINNASESAVAHVTLQGLTESIVVSPDSSAAYIAIPTAPVVGESPGIVQAISINGGSTGQATVPGVRYLSIDNTGSRLLGFSDNSDSVAVITPSNIGTPNVVSTPVGGFDRPVSAFFSSDGTTAYVVNCGAECGGTQAGVQTLDLTTNTAGIAIPVPAATIAFVSNSTMYLAGTPLANPQPCTGETTQATTCGLLTIFDLNRMSVTNTSPIVITDGYHDRIAMGSNGQLFIGSRTCTEVIPPVPPPTGSEVRGCLSIYNTQTGAVVIPPANGDVTGIQPIGKRAVVYVVQGGSLNIYDTTTDVLHSTQIINLIGQFFDVKTIDF